MTYCLGEVGLKPDEFWSMTFAEIDLACQGYETRMARVKEVPRVIAGILANVYSSKGTVNIESYIPLYTDKDKKMMTEEEYKETLKEFGHDLPTEEDKKLIMQRYGRK